MEKFVFIKGTLINLAHVASVEVYEGCIYFTFNFQFTEVGRQDAQYKFCYGKRYLKFMKSS